MAGVDPGGCDREASGPFYQKPCFIILAVIVVIVVIVVATSGGTTRRRSPPRRLAPASPGRRRTTSRRNAGESIDLDGVVVTTTALVDGEQSGTTRVLCSTVTVQNNSDESANSHGGFDWNLQDPNGASRMTTLAWKPEPAGRG